MRAIDRQSRIAIVGGGISGLALAIALKLKGFTRLKVFEKDDSFGSRRQGYGLTILQGKRVLKTLGVLEGAK
jgi:salicylate hydroxylase